VKTLEMLTNARICISKFEGNVTKCSVRFPYDCTTVVRHSLVGLQKWRWVIIYTLGPITITCSTY